MLESIRSLRQVCRGSILAIGLLVPGLELAVIPPAPTEAADQSRIDSRVAEEPDLEKLIPGKLIPESKAEPLEAKLGNRDSLASSTDWTPLDADQMAAMLHRCLETIGIEADAIGQTTDQFLSRVREGDTESLRAWVDAAAIEIAAVNEIVSRFQDGSNSQLLAMATRLDPSGPDYATIESMPPEMRAALRTWIGRELTRARLYDEALPVFAEVDPSLSPDAASLLFYRGACYHALLKAKEALSDLRSLLQHEADIPVRYARTATMMVADIKPLKEDSLDEISRLMTDVTRRLDLGRADEATQEREQEVIDKLTKLIDKIEEQQKQQQQKQQQSGEGQGGGNGGGQATPMEDSKIAGANGQGDVDRKSQSEKSGWGNLPPSERQESLQQISRDLPTHYREAIEAYFRKLATQK